MHVLANCTSDAVGRELAETRAKICMLGLGALQKSWPVGGWVYQLWSSVMDRLQRKLRYESHRMSSSADSASHSCSREGEAETINQLRAHGTPKSNRRFVGHDSPTELEGWQQDIGTGVLSNPLQHNMSYSDTMPDMADIFAFTDGTTRNIFDQSDFFTLLDFPL